MAEQTLGVSRGFIQVIQKGPRHKLNDYTQIRKVKAGVTTMKPGHLVSGSGETDGEIDLAASGDEFVSFVEIVLHQVGYTDRAKPDIDAVFAAGEYVLTMRPTGGKFIVAAFRADESNDTERGEPMVLEAAGMLQKWAYTDTAEATDVMSRYTFNCAEVTVDVAGTDLVQLIEW